MKFEFEGDGFDELHRKLENLQKNVESVEGSVRIEELITPGFLAACSRFGSLEEFFGGADIKTDEDLKAKDATEFDNYVAENTSYRNWEQMLGVAAEKFVAGKMDLDLE